MTKINRIRCVNSMETAGLIQKRNVFGRRAKGLSVSRQEALAVLPKFTFALTTLPGTLDPHTLFTQPRQQIWLECGFGDGERLFYQAQQHPEDGFLGAEPYEAGVSLLVKDMLAADTENIRLHLDDGWGLLQALQTASIDHFALICPDPWPKKRHHIRRFLQPPVLAEIIRVVKPGGSVLLASDHAGMQAWLHQHALNEPQLIWADASAELNWQRPATEPLTRFGRKALTAGREMQYFRFKRQ